MSSKPSKSTSSKAKSSSSKKVAAPAVSTAKKAKKTDVVVETAKAAAPAPVVVEKPAVAVKDVPVMAAPTRTVSRAEFLDLVRKEAYQRAARRNFRNGSPFQDWVHAEAHVSGQLASQGVQLS
jgi:hypothetical protein